MQEVLLRQVTRGVEGTQEEAEFMGGFHQRRKMFKPKHRVLLQCRRAGILSSSDPTANKGWICKDVKSSREG